MGLLTPPATPHGAQHTASPSTNQLTPHQVPANQNTACQCRTSPHAHAPPITPSHHGQTPPPSQSPYAQAPPPASSPHSVATPQFSSATPTTQGFSSNGHSSPLSHGKAMHTGCATQTTSMTTAQSVPSPLMCSMAVNTGQSLLWTDPQMGMNHISPSQPLAETTHPTERKSRDSHRDHCTDEHFYIDSSWIAEWKPKRKKQCARSLPSQ